MVRVRVIVEHGRSRADNDSEGFQAADYKKSREERDSVGVRAGNSQTCKRELAKVYYLRSNRLRLQL